MEKIIAIVVTYNRLELLKECIEALRNQTKSADIILVVNNGSNDNTAQWLAAQTDLTCIHQKNTGSGGGFSTGISWAYKNGYSWIWCMDDDGYPKEDALEKILAPDTDRLCLRNCAVLQKGDKKTFVWKTGKYATIDEVDTTLIKGIGHPFNGTMIHRNIIERVGIPQPSLFMWGDESEYYVRITKKNKIPVVTVADSIHYHPPAVFSFKKDWDFSQNWKMYFYVRNRLHIQRSQYSNKALALVKYCYFLTAMVGVILFFQKTDKFNKLLFLSWPAIGAISNNFDATPTLILERLNSHPLNVYKASLSRELAALMFYVSAPFNMFRVRRAATGM